MRNLLDSRTDPCAGKELNVQCHLVVAGTARVHLLAQRSQPLLHLRVDILSVDDESALKSLLAEFLQLRKERIEVLLRQQAHLGEHRDVRHRPFDIVRGQQQVQLPVLAHRERIHAGVVVKAFIPDFHKLQIMPDKLLRRGPPPKAGCTPPPYANGPIRPAPA